jgi:hypothetical protein
MTLAPRVFETLAANSIFTHLITESAEIETGSVI